MNQDYLYLTLRSIINNCNNDFHIILIDDDSFKNLLPNWRIDMNKVGNIQKDNLRSLALVKILYNYGGILIEPSFILFKSLIKVYNLIKTINKPFVGEFLNESVNSNKMNIVPSMKLLGCVKNCKYIHELEVYLEMLINNDNTLSSKFEVEINNWIFNKVNNKEFNCIDGKHLGTKDINNKIIKLEDLFSSSYIDFNLDLLGIYVPHRDILKRHSFNWFVYLNSKEILESNINLSKYLLLAVK